jgi:hypothetical protein
VTSTNGVGIVVERSMWFPGRNLRSWVDGHTGHGLGPALRWRVPAQFGEHYVLIFNPTAQPTGARLSVGPGEPVLVDVPAYSRINVPVSAMPELLRYRTLLVESTTTVPLVVEWSNYIGTRTWTGGSNAPAFPVPEP